MFAFFTAARTVSYDDARDPVCDDMACLDFSELPGAIKRIGFLDLCTMDTNSFPSENSSRYMATAFTSGFERKYGISSFSFISALFPTDIT